jgi:two-component system, NarL family, nitrate/nitrite response regulator NarL
MNPLRIFIVADDLLVRTGLSTLLVAQSDMRVVGQANGATLSDDMDVYRPDVVLWDLGWNEANAKRLANIGETSVLVLVGDSETMPTVLASLAHTPIYGVLPRDSHPELLVTALNTIGNGLIVLAPSLSNWLSSPAPLVSDILTEELTARETEVLQLLAQGLTNKAIALRLGITDHTVKFHVNAIMTKLNAQSRTEAVIKATRAGAIVL